MKWLLPDAGQAVLPTTHGNEDTYPLGVAVTSAATKSIEQGRMHVIISRSKVQVSVVQSKARKIDLLSLHVN